MGQATSRPNNNGGNSDHEQPSTTLGLPYESLAIPEEVSRKPEDCKHWYADFFEQAYVAPHRDGKSVVVFWPESKQGFYEESEEKTHVIRTAEVYERLFLNNSGHPRIVKYLRRLNSCAGFCLERLTPGPLETLTLPPLTLPIVSPSAQDRILLALYYRWALQSLSALHYMHANSVFLTDFGSKSVWIRADMSIALTGFISAAIPTPVPADDNDSEADKLTYEISTPPTSWRSEDIECFDISSETPPNAAYDLFDWATWMWRLMTNDRSTNPPVQPNGFANQPIFPIDLASWPNFNNVNRRKYERERQENRAWQVLEEQRLGNILVKAWNQEYQSAEQAMQDVKEMAEKMNMKLIGEDEIELQAGKWEDVFEVVQTGEDAYDQELRLANPEGNIPAI